MGTHRKDKNGVNLHMELAYPMNQLGQPDH